MTRVIEPSPYQVVFRVDDLSISDISCRYFEHPYLTQQDLMFSYCLLPHKLQSMCSSFLSSTALTGPWPKRVATVSISTLPISGQQVQTSALRIKHTENLEVLSRKISYVLIQSGHQEGSEISPVYTVSSPQPPPGSNSKEDFQLALVNMNSATYLNI